MPVLQLIPSWQFEQFECEIGRIDPGDDPPQAFWLHLPVLLRASEFSSEQMALRFYSGESFLCAVLARSPKATIAVR